MKRQHVLSLGSVAAVLVACTIYLVVGVLRVPVVGGATTVEISMPRTGGLFETAGVTYNGIVVGTVTDVGLTRGGVSVRVRLHPGARIPSDSEVRVRSLSPIGEQYLDFQPRTAEGPYLGDGDRITADAADLPQSIGDLAISLDELMTQVDPVKVRSVLGELRTGLDGAEDDIQRLTADSLTLVDALDDSSGLLVDFLGQSNRLLRLGVDSKADIVTASRDYATFISWLRTYQPELYRTLARAPGQMEEMRRLMHDLGAVLPGFLGAHADVSEFLNARNPHLRALLQNFPAAVSQLADVMRHGRLQLDQMLRRGPWCDYPTVERAPRDTSYRSLQDGGGCSTSLRDHAQRGAQFAPGPTR